ncbi:MAG: hypothetical protein V1708_04325 [Candidatus Micrarchaeota archaeon]
MVRLAEGFDFVSALTLVAAFLVLLYLLNYLLILYSQKRKGRIRWDWTVSALFYTGIGLFALGYVFRNVDFCSGLCVRNWYQVFDLLALVFFLTGFKKRADMSETVEVDVLELAEIKRRKKR